MAGRSIMVAAALGVVALAASCVGAPLVSANQDSGAAFAQTTQASPPNAPLLQSPALAMALATEQAAAGPVAAPYGARDEDGMRGLMQSPAVAPQAQFTMGVREAPYGPDALQAPAPGGEAFQPLELSLTHASAFGLDVAIAHRTGSNQDDSGARTTSGAEVRIGQRLSSLVGAKEFETPTSWQKPAWYVFAASDGQALTFTPSNDAMNRNFRLQDRVNIGDVQAGISIEANGTQASLSYIQREVTTMDLIRHTETTQESFIGLTLTRRR